MALDYDGSPNGLFVQVGGGIKEYNLQGADGVGLSAELDDLLDLFESMTAGDSELMVEGVATSFATWETQYATRRASIAALVTRRLQDQETVLDELGLATNEIQSVLAALIRQMRIDNESVDISTVTFGSVTADGANNGDGTILVTKMLDGATSPGSGAAGEYRANVEYAGIDSELALNETHVIRCVADSFSDGLTEGNETWAWNGQTRQAQHSIASEGTGEVSPSPAGAHSQNLQKLTNADFENWTTDDLDDWSAVGSTFGDLIERDQSAGNFYHGSSAVKLTGDGVETELGIRQSIFVAGKFAGRKLYRATARIKASATIAAGDLTIQLAGTGYVPGVGESVEILAGALPTTWTLVNFFVLMPAEIPSDLAFEAIWDGTPTNAKSLWLDDLSLSAVQYGGGIGLTIVRGASPFVRNDRFTLPTSNDDAGVIQRFFRQVYGVQLRSAASETIDDALAT
jgi:hypothetical protein